MRVRSWLAASAAVASLALVAPRARADERTEARREFRAGMELIRQGAYDAGIRHLEKAYDTLPHPNVLYNIALAHLHAGRPDAAIYYLERYRETVTQSDAVEVESLLAQLRTSTDTRAKPAREEAQAPPPQERRAEHVARATPAGDELAVIESAAAELRRMAEVSNSEAFRKRADELSKAAESLRAERARAAAREVASAKPSNVIAAPTTPTTNSAPPTTRLSAEQNAEQGAYEEEVVSASRFKESPLDAPNATAIITAQDIRLTGITNINELLRRVAGVEVNSVTPNHAEVSIRGLNRRTSNKVLVLLDGRPLRQDFLGSSWLDFLPISVEDVERIEVIRGPASALYGADAFSGIINIITRAPGQGSSFVAGGAGNKEQGRAVSSFTGREGELSYHFGVGYAQADNAVRVVGKNRVDDAPLTSTPNLATRKVWTNGELRYPLGNKTLATVGAALVYGDHNVQGLSRLGQVTVDDSLVSQVHSSLALPAGVKLSSFWNRFDGNAGASQITPGAIDLVSHGAVQDIVDVDLSWTHSFRALVPQTFTLGGGYRFKSIQHWAWLDGDHTQHHFSAYAQDVLQVAKALRIQLSGRIDRHPLLRSLQISPRGSVVVRMTEGQSLRATVGRAFRGPSFLESYLEVPNAAPVRGVSAWGIGNARLDPESITSYELGYLNQASDYLALEANAYFNLVKNAILFTDVETFTLRDYADPDSPLAKFDASSDSFPISTLRFTNEQATFRQLGGELGARVYPVRGLDIYANFAVHDTRPLDASEVDPVRAKEQQTSRHKVNTGIQYRAAFGLDTSVDMHWFSKQVWVEQVTDLERGVRFEAFDQPAFVLVNGRIGYRLLRDRLELGVVGSNVALQHKRQHPFGQPVDTRVMATTKVRF